MNKIILGIVMCFALAMPVKAEMVATTSSEMATASASVEKAPPEKTDLTQPTNETKNKLQRVLDENPVGELSWKNFLRYAINKAVDNGVPINTVVLILLFPLVVAIVAAARHLIGVRGAGILTPALLSVAFLATGIWAGAALFLVILIVTVLGRTALKSLKLQYLPRVSLLLWVVSAGVFLTLFAASIWNVSQLVTVGIFPILILMLLAETFIDIQAGRSGSEARALIFQTFALAMISSLLLGNEMVQRALLMWPELIFFGVAVFDLFMGRYTGLRLSEYLMYRGIVKEDEEE
ncbi:MAG: 7TM domain-containing protein [Microgenomates group bacterium]